MTNYRERWHTQNSVDFVPAALRSMCDDSLSEIFSNSPMHPNEAQLMAAHKALQAANAKRDTSQ